MSLILDLDSSTERKLKAAASQNGTTSEAFAITALKHGLSQATAKPLKRYSTTELLSEINRGMSEEKWERYAILVARRREETLTQKQLKELRAFSDRLETLNARRMECVAELARRRGTELDTEIDRLGISPRNV